MTGGKHSNPQSRPAGESLTRWLKRGVSLAALATGLVIGLDHLGIHVTSLAQRATRQVAAPNTTGENCSYLQEPAAIRDAQLRHRRSISRTTEEFAERLANDPTLHLTNPGELPRKNFIDDILFGKMQADGIQSAPLIGDAEYMRRVTLDLTGRIPKPVDVTAFLADTDPNKRDALVDRLMATSEFVDRWTLFYGDLVRNTAFAGNINRYRYGRDAYHNFLYESVASGKSWAQMATEMIAANGDNYVVGATNFTVGAHVAGGPAQDVYDGLAVEASRIFLGLSSMDCLLCHDGAGHLDAVNLWGSTATRAQAYGMSAFFARMRKPATTVSSTPFYNKYTINEAATGEYQLGTTVGNRSPRGGRTSDTAQPAYMFNGGGAVKAGENRREAFARYLTADPQFARAHVNYLWEKIMVEALVSPSHTFDLARIQPDATMPDGWALQPANAELLKALAEDFAANGFNFRRTVELIVKSNAYQLSSVYPGEWTLGKVPYYARKFVRRLDGEEIHDAVVIATGIPATMADPDNGNRVRVGYRMTFDNNTTSQWLEWAGQMPEPTEPRSNGNRVFVQSFLTGDRDQKMRSAEPSILQALNMMNNGFVRNRMLSGATATVTYPENRTYVSSVRELTTLAPSNTYEFITEQLFLRTLSRKPTDAEMTKLRAYFTKQTKTAYAENLQWVLFNKIEFLYNY
jgi:hypothetical protein